MRSIVFLAATAAAVLGGKETGPEQPLKRKREEDVNEALLRGLDSLATSGKRRFLRRATQSRTFATSTFQKAITSSVKQVDKDLGMTVGVAAAINSVVVQQLLRDCLPGVGFVAQQTAGALGGMMTGLTIHALRKLGCGESVADRAAKIHKHTALRAYVAMLAADVAMSPVNHFLYDFHSPCFSNFVLRIVAAGASLKLAGVNSGGFNNDLPSDFYKWIRSEKTGSSIEIGEGKGGRSSELQDAIRMVVQDATFGIGPHDIIHAAEQLRLENKMTVPNYDRIVTAAHTVAKEVACSPCPSLDDV